MSKEIYISSTPHETRLAIVENDALTEIYYERENEYTLAGSIYNGRVTRVLPGMQSSFVDIGLERDAFLYITDFMEEAPDSAEFDTTSHAERTPRQPRPVVTSAAAPDAAPAEGNGQRSDREGGGRRGRRGGRDRDRNGDRSANRQPQGSSDAAAQPSHEAPSTPDAPFADVGPVPSSDTGEIGEGAPGADGSRRWRGRRGRRRGRGPGQRDEMPQATPGSETPGLVASEAEGSTFEETEPSVPFEFDGSAEPEASSLPVERSAPPEPEARRADGNRPGREGGRRDRNRRDGRREAGGRDDNRGREDAPRRDEGRPPDERAARAPRGFAPSTDLYKVHTDEASGTAPVANAYGETETPAEPIILPGESLSKYRKGENGESTFSQQEAAPSLPTAPTTLYTLATGWDGSSVLPGETLRSRPQGRTDTPAPGRNDARGEGRRDAQRDGGRGPRDGRNDRGQRGPRRDDRQNFRNPAPIALDAASEIPHHNAPPTPEPHAEYEPHEASASYRVDPIPVQEYRQSAPVLEHPPEEFVELAPSPEFVSQSDEDDFEESMETSVEPVHSIAHTVTPDPVVPEPEIVEAPAEPTKSATGHGPSRATEFFQASFAAHDVTSVLHTGDMLTEPAEVVSAAVHTLTPEAPAEPAATHTAEPFAAHDVTSVLASGEMLSEPITDVAAPVHELTPIDSVEPSSPMHHEGAVVAQHSAAQIHETFEEEDEDDDSADETESEGATLHASSFEEMDDLDDEETLEGAADLSTMLREMSIDQMTRTSPEGEEAHSSEDELEDADEYESEEYEESEEEEGEDGAEPSEEAARAGTPSDAAFFEAQFGQAEESAPREASATPSQDSDRRGGRREGGRRDGRRDGRREGRGESRRSGSGDRARSTGGAGDPMGGPRRSMQSTNLPAISDLLKPGQEILCQIAKEPIAKKGARITSHIALPGRFLVFMPTVHHTGVSRKIESDGERRRLKEILLSEKGDAAGGFIVRTAAEGASEEELRSDLRFLLNLWADIKSRSESSKSPALIYHDLNLIERILRDQVTDSFSAIWVDSESEYERVLRFLQRFQPSLIRRVKLYSKETPLFEQFGITEEINKALRSKVWLKSGGSIVINQTEALVAIDINTGKFVGKTARLEDTIVKTNLDAIPEIVRQIRLRDLGGIIIIDFIDMDERKNRNKVMAALEEELKSDRAPSKVLQFNDFGLVAITRKRVKQSLERTLSTTCEVCQGTGMVKSPITVCNDIYVEMKKMHKHLDRGDVMLRVHPEVVKQLKTSGAKWLHEMEEVSGKTILLKSDPSLHPEQFDIH